MLSLVRCHVCMLFFSVNANLDMIVSAVDLMAKLEANSTLPLDKSVLRSLSDLSELVAYSMLHCAGVERTFIDQSIYRNIMKSASSIPHRVSRWKSIQ